MKISFNNVHEKSLKTKARLLRRFSNVIDRGQYFHGPENDKLKRRLETYFRRGYISLVGSGHDSLLLALQSLNLKPTDELIIPANVYPTAFPAALSGAAVVLADVDKNGLIDVRDVSHRITAKTKAVIAVHLYGLVVDIPELRKTVGNSVAIIEDCAQAFGSLYKNKPVGTLGDVGCFSFYPTKNLGGYGDGGAVWTSNNSRYGYIEKAASYGERVKYEGQFISGHSRLPELQAAVLNVHFDTFGRERAAKKNAVRIYRNEFANHIPEHMSRIVFHDTDSDPTMHLMVIEADRRDNLKQYLGRKSIPALIHYPHPVHRVKAFSHLNGAYPVSEWLSQRILSLPFHSSLSKNDIHYIVETVRNFYEKTP